MSQDALSLVREATMTGTPVKYVDNHYIFGHHKFHEGTKTCFKRSLNCKNPYLTLSSFINTEEKGYFDKEFLLLS